MCAAMKLRRDRKVPFGGEEHVAGSPNVMLRKHGVLMNNQKKNNTMSCTHTVCNSKNEAFAKQEEYITNFIEKINNDPTRKLWGKPEVDKQRRSIIINVKTINDWDESYRTMVFYERAIRSWVVSEW
jgi:hypothetical protein